MLLRCILRKNILDMNDHINHKAENPQWNTRRLLIPYILTPWSTVLLEKQTGFATNQEIPHILWNPKVHYHTHGRPPTVPILSQLHPFSTTHSHFLKIHFNSILPSTSWSPQWSLSLTFPHRNLVHTSPLLHTCHTPYPSHSSRFYHRHNIGWGVLFTAFTKIIAPHMPQLNTVTFPTVYYSSCYYSW